MKTVTETKYNGSIEIYRYVLTLCVGLMHFYNSHYHGYKFFEGAYLAVDFFFMLSGFYLINTLSKKPDLSAFGFSFRKYRSFFWIYVSSIILCDFGAFRNGIKLGMVKLIDTIPDMLCLQMSGVFYPNTNTVLWYISAMMIAGFFIAIVYRLSRNISCNLVFSLLAMLGYSYIYLGANNLDVSTLMNGKHVVAPGVVRAFAGMSTGGVFT